MHKITCKPNHLGMNEYREECLNPNCKDTTMWIFTDAFQLPSCKICRNILNAKAFFNRQTFRKVYHLAKAGAND